MAFLLTCSMLKRLFSIITLCVIGAAPLAAQTTVTDSIYCGGKYRSYILYVPAIYNALHATPLVINMHGYTSNAQQQQYYGNFMPVADTANFLVIHPQGTYYNGQAFWNAGISPTLVNDVQFISNLIDSISAQYNVDPNSVYATGLSNGGFMSQTLACVLNNRIAAIASVSGTQFTQQYSSCTPVRPVPVLHIHGTADGVVPYAGNSSEEPADTIISFWRRHNQCNPTAQFSNVPNTNTSDGCTAEHYVYTGGIDNSSVELYKIIGGGHSWPGAPIVIDVTNMDFNASVEIWRFFRKYKLSQLTSVNELEALKNEVSVYPNPATGLVYVHTNETTIDQVVLKDLSGRIILQQASTTVDLSGLRAGVYFIEAHAKHNTVVKKIVKD